MEKFLDIDDHSKSTERLFLRGKESVIGQNSTLFFERWTSGRCIVCMVKSHNYGEKPICKLKDCYITFNCDDKTLTSFPIPDGWIGKMNFDVNAFIEGCQFEFSEELLKTIADSNTLEVKIEPLGYVENANAIKTYAQLAYNALFDQTAYIDTVIDKLGIFLKSDGNSDFDQMITGYVEPRARVYVSDYVEPRKNNRQTTEKKYDYVDDNKKSSTSDTLSKIISIITYVAIFLILICFVVIIISLIAMALGAPMPEFLALIGRSKISTI